MTAFKRRDKVLLFRLTREEYDLLLAACAKRGARSLSDFARTVLLASIEHDQVNQRLGQLQSAVQEVTGMLEAIVTAKGANQP